MGTIGLVPFCISWIILLVALDNPSVVAGSKSIYQKTYARAESWIDSLVVCLFTLWFFDYLNIFDRPAGFDHNAHVARVTLFKSQILSHGVPHGWTNTWFTGWPVGYFYPYVMDLWTLLFDALSFGQLGLDRSYALGFAAFLMLRSLLIFNLACKWSGSRLVGFMTCLFLVIDTGASREGGWTYAIHAGVWLQEFSAFFSLLLIHKLSDPDLKPNLRSIGTIGLMVGLSLLSHPLQAINVSLIFAIYAATSWHKRNTPRIFLGLCIGILISCAWLLPFLHFKAFVFDHPPRIGGYENLKEFAKAFVSSGVLRNNIPMVSLLGIIGTFTFIYSGDHRKKFLAIYVGCLILLTSNFLTEELSLNKWLGILDQVLLRRYLMLAKPIIYFFASFSLVWFGRHFIRRRDDAKTRELILSGAIGGGFIYFLLLGAQTIHTTPRKMHTLSDREKVLTELPELKQWISSLPDSTPESFYRIALMGDDRHAIRDLSVQTKAPMITSSFTPAANFIYRTGEAHRVIFNQARVRYAIDYKFKWADKKFKEKFTLIKKIGTFSIYEYQYWKPNIISGSEHVAATEISNDRIVISNSGNEPARVVLHISFFPQWHAFHQETGAEVDIETNVYKGKRRKLGHMKMRVPPGTTELIFSIGWIEITGYILGLFGLFLSLALIYNPKIAYVWRLRRCLIR